ncbi:hypothetical protein PUR49_01140 [Streptomyces sp. BE147]|nr:MULTISPECIES: hypothetical protein [unclassified Streptomyces]MCX4970832.1 hypothetical protein [Streptomyces sp. NBC_00654]MEE1735155.1 hypothetical protein [Streptomyces sp. BE147]
MPVNRTQQIVLALVGTGLVGHIAYAYPSAIPVLTLCVAVFIALSALLSQ